MARRPGFGKTICEDCLTLDINCWHRGSHLRLGHYFTWTWSFPSGATASIGVTVLASAVILRYRRHGEEHPVEQRVALTTTDCPYGSTRPWYLCPSCRKRVGKLYLSGHPCTFACRQCHDLTYVTRQEGLKFRGLSRANQLRAKLGGPPGMDAPIPPKPKRMHHATYAGIVRKIAHLEEGANFCATRHFR